MFSRNEYSLAEAIQQWFKDCNLDEKLHERQLRRQWPDLFGPAFAKYTETIALRNKKLVLRITSAPLRQEIWYNRQQMLQRINDALGADAVHELVLR